MIDSNDIALTTEEGHAVTLTRFDFDALNRWPGLDMTRLLVVGEDAVHARRTDGSVHPQSLEDLLATVNVTAVLKAPLVSEAITNKPRSGGLLEYFERTGNARPSRRALTGEATGPRPTVFVNGQPLLLRVTTFEAGRAKVPVTAPGSRDVVAWAYMPQADFEALRRSRDRPDILAWRMGPDGRPTTRVKQGAADSQTQAVSDLLAVLGLQSGGLVLEAVG